MRLSLLQALAPELTAMLKPYEAGKQGFVTPEAGIAGPEPMYDASTGMPLNYIQQAGQGREYYVPQGGEAITEAELRGRLPVAADSSIAGLTVDGPQDLMRNGRSYGQRAVIPLPPQQRRPNAQLGVGNQSAIRQIPRQNAQLGVGNQSAIRQIPPAPPSPDTSQPRTTRPWEATQDVEPGIVSPAMTANMEGMGYLRQSQGALANYRGLDATIGDLLAKFNIRLPALSQRANGPTSRAEPARPVGEARGAANTPDALWVHDFNTPFTARRPDEYRSLTEEADRRFHQQALNELKLEEERPRPPRLTPYPR